MAHKVITPYSLPKAPQILNEDSIRSWMNDITRIMSVIISILQQPDIIIYTLTTLPDASDRNKGEIVFVSDGIAGQQFRGSTGSSWVNLG